MTIAPIIATPDEAVKQANAEIKKAHLIGYELAIDKCKALAHTQGNIFIKLVFRMRSGSVPNLHTMRNSLQEQDYDFKVLFQLHGFSEVLLMPNGETVYIGTTYLKPKTQKNLRGEKRR